MITEEAKYQKAKTILDKIDELGNRIGQTPGLGTFEDSLIQSYFLQKNALTGVYRELGEMRKTILELIEGIDVPESSSSSNGTSNNKIVGMIHPEVPTKE